MQRTKEIALDGKRYDTTQYSATFGLKLLTRLSKVIGKPLAILTTTDQDSEVGADLISRAVEALTKEIDEDSVLTLVLDILHTTTIVANGNERRPIEFNTDFAGCYGHLFRLIKEVLSFQYSDFFGELAAVAPAGRAHPGKIKARG